MKLIDIISKNREWGAQLQGEPFSIAVLSNITMNQLQPVLEYTLREQGINAQVQLGDFDNIVQDSVKFQDSKAVVIFWELMHLNEHFSEDVVDVDEWSTELIASYVEQIKTDLKFVFRQLKNTPLVIMSTFSSEGTQSDEIMDVANQLNTYLKTIEVNNIFLADKQEIFRITGQNNSYNLSRWASTKAFYTVPFFVNYCQLVKPIFLAATGRSKKALILDCDNTLWKGIVGEDGPEGIEVSDAFRQVQEIAVELSKQGIIIGLNSKNNSEDVAEAFAQNDMPLKEEHLVIKKVNWNDKASNLREIAQQLNIGIDSLVMVDDSSFEVNLIREQLPEVTVIQVPENIEEYPQRIKNILGLFHNNSTTEEDAAKTKMYQQQVQREEEKKGYNSIEDYLASLELYMHVFAYNDRHIARFSQLTQKTNQFNLTTKRYTEKEIEQLNKSGAYMPCFELTDRFGDYGITGLCIAMLDEENKKAFIDIFLMSCRVIGRNIEFAFFDCIVETLQSKGIETLEMEYISTVKNAQVAHLYEKLGAELTTEKNGVKQYQLNLSTYQPHNISYIKWKNG